MIKDYVQNIISLSLIKGVGSAFMKKHRAMLLNYKDNIDLLTNIGGKVTLQEFNKNLSISKEIIDTCLQNDIGIITIADDWYPQLLIEIKDPPPIIFYKGNLDNINKPIALIGTRKATDLGNRIGEKVTEYFNKDYSICNGLAEGIDTSTIEPKGKTIEGAIGILSGGLNFSKSLTKKNARLAESVLDNNGLLISEFEPNKKEDSFSSIKACRIQAGLSQCLILIQSPKNGGSKYTIKSFSEVDRPLGIINFSGNKEYDSAEIFSANRIIISNGIQGIAEVTDIKKLNNIKTKSIIPISSSDDYELIKEKIKPAANNAYTSNTL
jgi:DNA processing protein